MEFDWNNPPFDLDSSLTRQEIEESFEDPFAVRLLPDTPRFSVQARFFILGMSAGGTGIFSVYRTNGKQVRIIHSRPMEPEERFSTSGSWTRHWRIDGFFGFESRKVGERQIMNSFTSWDEVPLFDSEGAEADYWAEYRPDLRLMESAVASSSESSESVTINLRIDPRMLARIKRLARSRYLNYQSMIKQWLSERMESELRER